MTKANDRYMAVILTLSLATLIGCMNMAIFNVALPALMVYFDTDVTTIQWLTSGFTLPAGVVTPVVGFLGDKFSYKKNIEYHGVLCVGAVCSGDVCMVCRSTDCRAHFIRYDSRYDDAAIFGHAVSDCPETSSGESCRHLGGLPTLWAVRCQVYCPGLSLPMPAGICCF